MNDNEIARGMYEAWHNNTNVLGDVARKLANFDVSLHPRPGNVGVRAPKEQIWTLGVDCLGLTKQQANEFASIVYEAEATQAIISYLFGQFKQIEPVKDVEVARPAYTEPQLQERVNQLLAEARAHEEAAADIYRKVKPLTDSIAHLNEASRLLDTARKEGTL